MTEPELVLCLVCTLLLPFATAGVALIQQGLGRSRSAAHAMLSSLCVCAVAAIGYLALGQSWAGVAGGPSHVQHFYGMDWNWLGNGRMVAAHLPTGDPTAGAALCFHLFAVGLAASIALGAGSDRWRLPAICACAGVFALLPYPLFAHWSWEGGWLRSLPTQLGLAGFVDVGGAATIQTLGGLLALSVAWILGPRRGKYLGDGIVIAIPGHNMVLVLFGCLLATVGWAGLEISASLLFAHARLGSVPPILVNTLLAASGGGLAAVVVTQLRFHKTDASLSANGWIAGLVAGSAACGLVSPLAALFTGAVAGVFVPPLVDVLEGKLMIDDPGGTVSVHGAAGLWGLLAAGLFLPADGAGRGNHLLVQLLGVATLLGLMLPLLHGINLALNRIVPFRADHDAERHGMDIRELGAGAYPEFVKHAEEFGSR